MYVCGVTPYNHPHIGNARPFVTWDVIRRYMKHVGYKVTYVQNFTDVDDKIINTSNGEGVSWDTIANRYIDSYFEVMDALGVQHADIYPRVSTHIEDIIAMISTLIEKGYAYELDGDVYYSVDKFEHYGELSGRTLDDMVVRKILWTLHYGNLQNQANHIGKALGGMAVQVGILNVLP